MLVFAPAASRSKTRRRNAAKSAKIAETVGLFGAWVSWLRSQLKSLEELVAGRNSMGLSTTVLGSAAAVVVVLDGANGFLAFPSGRGEGSAVCFEQQQQFGGSRARIALASPAPL